MTAQDKSHSTPLHVASSSMISDELLRLLIEHGADATAKNKAGKTPLHLVSSWVSAIARVSSVIRRRADINGQVDCDWNSSGWDVTKAETVQLLIEHGAEVTAKDEASSTPLHLACSHVSAKTVQLLIEHGADVAAQDESHRTPLHLASSWASTTTVSLFIQQQVDVKDRFMRNTMKRNAV